MIYGIDESDCTHTKTLTTLDSEICTTCGEIIQEKPLDGYVGPCWCTFVNMIGQDLFQCVECGEQMSFGEAYERKCSIQS